MEKLEVVTAVKIFICKNNFSQVRVNSGVLERGSEIDPEKESLQG